MLGENANHPEINRSSLATSTLSPNTITLKSVNRHSPFYIKDLQRGKNVTTNRNQVLLNAYSSQGAAAGGIGQQDQVGYGPPLPENFSFINNNFEFQEPQQPPLRASGPGNPVGQS